MDKLIHYVILLLAIIGVKTEEVIQKTINVTIPKYNIENYCKLRISHFELKPWSAASFEFGTIVNKKGHPLSWDIHNCKLDIRTQKGFGLAVAIESMKIRGKRKGKNEWDCSDYIKFVSSDDGFLQGLLSRLDVNILASATSSELCGIKKLNGSLVNDKEIIGLKSAANSFFTYVNEMTLSLHQDKDYLGQYNNSFILIITSFKLSKDEEFTGACKDKFVCQKSPLICINPKYTCDGHVNCPFVGSGLDELSCREDKKEEKGTSFVHYLLYGIGGICAIVFIVGLIGYLSRDKSARSDFRRDSDTTDRIDLPPPFPEGTSVTKPFNVEELPPSYHDIYPHGKIET